MSTTIILALLGIIILILGVWHRQERAAQLDEEERERWLNMGQG